jgi:ABC-type lipoprotein export system ATPase subunit
VTAAIEIGDLFRVYATSEGRGAALQGLSLFVEERDVVVVLGPSGAGKTTLLRIVAGLDRPSAGSARVFGTDVQRLSGRSLARYRATTVGYVDQHYSQALAPELSAHDAVSLRLRMLGVPRSRRRRRADELLQRVGLFDKRDARPSELSGGEQQRVAVCAALAHGPRLLLADEPTGELDAVSARLVYDTIADLVREQRSTALIVSHDQASTAIADRVVHVRDGRVAEETRSDGAHEAIVVGQGGWLRIPEELLTRAGIRTLARATVADERIILSPAEETSPADSAPPPAAVAEVESAAVSRRRGAGVELRSITKTYGAGARRTSPFAGLSASFEPHRFHAITGPSGSGKTTLLQLISGLELPTAGEVVLADEIVSRLDREQRAALRAKWIGVVGQQAGLVPFLSAQENVELALLVRGRNGASALATRALAAVGLADRVDQRVSRLSSGEKARVAIARAVAANPAVLLADEPTSRLDAANALAVASLFRRLTSERGVTVICATHDPLVIEEADAEISLIKTSG